MEKKKYLYITLFLLAFVVISNTVMINKAKKEKKTMQIQVEKSNELSHKAHDLVLDLEEMVLIQQASEAINCDFLEVKCSQENRNIPLEEIIDSSGPLLFYRVKETDCPSCVKTTTRDLLKFSKEFPSRHIIVLVGGYTNVRQLRAFTQSYQGKFRVFSVDDLPVPAEEHDKPFFFVVTEEMKIQNVFIVKEGFSSFTAGYLHCMAHKYWDIHIGNNKCYHN